MIAPSISDVARIATNLARNCGYAVFPCRADKSPATRRGYKDAAKAADAIAELWRAHPGPLIGVATGVISNIAVVDVDRKRDEGVLWWQANCSSLLPTRVCETRSGGLHIFFRHAEGVGCSAGKICPGIDVRGDGGYIIHWFAAGFACLDHSPPAAWPNWLSVALARPAHTTRRRPARAPDDRALDGLLHRITGAPEGERNQILFWSACRAHERGQLKSATGALIAAAINAGLSEVEARRTVASAGRAG